MMDKACITFYEVERCGFYRRGAEKPEFGNFREIVDELRKWIDGKSLGETKTFDEDAESNCSYCCGIKKGETTFLLTMWNEVPSNRGRIAMLDPKSEVGSPSVRMGEVRPGMIPGFASYYWLLPADGRIASIAFPRVHRQVGHHQMSKYVLGFLSLYPGYARTAEDTDGNLVTKGYSDGEEGPLLDNVRPIFQAPRLRRLGQLDHIRKHRNEIRKVIRKTSLTPENRQERSLLDRLFEKAGVAEARMSPGPVRIRYEVDHTPNRRELEALIEECHHPDGDTWEDTGVRLSGESSVRWFSKSLARANVDLDVRWGADDEVVEPGSLVAELEGAKARLARLAEG